MRQYTYDVRNPASKIPTNIRQANRPPKFFTEAVAADATPNNIIMPGRLYLAETALVIKPDAGPNTTNTT
jgi:hypothetical protein